LKEAYNEQREKRKRITGISNPSSSTTWVSSRQLHEETENGLIVPTYLQNIDTLPRNLAVNLVFIVKVSSVHLGRLIHGMFNLHCDATTGLGLLDKLREEKKERRVGSS
jgi:hypothetical protein